MKILITGVSGQVGSQIFDISDNENYGTYFGTEPRGKNENMFNVDIRNREKVFEIVKKVKPDWIIHCAAATKVDLCETDKKYAFEINVNGTKNLVDASKEIDSKFLYVSTDYVFDGNKGNYKETDKTNPINNYGATKLEAELYVKKLKDHLIMRTSHVYSHIGENFVLWAIKRLQTGNLECPGDMISSPTLAGELGEAILKTIDKGLLGTYHAAGNEHISRYNFAKKIAKTFDYDVSNIKPVKMKEINFIAKRPINSSLDISKISKGGVKFSDVDSCLRRLKMKMNSNS